MKNSKRRREQEEALAQVKKYESILPGLKENSPPWDAVHKKLTMARDRYISALRRRQ